MNDPRTPEQIAAQADCLAMLALQRVCDNPRCRRGWMILRRPNCHDYVCEIAIPHTPDMLPEDCRVMAAGPRLCDAIMAAMRKAGLLSD